MSHSMTITDFEANPGPALKAARAGERIVITSQGAPVAELAPLRSPEEILQELARAGRVRPGDRSRRVPAGVPAGERIPLERILEVGDWDAG